MNPTILKNAGIDYDYCVKRFVGRAHLLEKALSKFLKDDTMTRVRADYAAGDAPALLADAHEFKGMCGNIGMTPLYEASCALVSMLRAGDGYAPEALDAAYTRLCERYDRIYDAVAASMEAGV